MKLSLEWSSRRLSVAVAIEDRLEEACLELPRFRAPEALGLVDQLLEDLGRDLAQVEELRIGRGPGNYSGVRQAFSWAAGVCAPGGILLKAVASGQAQALRLAQVDATRFWILGDARRGMWWGAQGGAEMQWSLKTPEDWRALIWQDRVFSAEADRLEGIPCLEQDEPRATDLFLLGPDQLLDQTEPLYLHPPVSSPK